MSASPYPDKIAGLIDPDRLMELGPGSPNRAAKAKLESLRPEDIAETIHDRDMARACLAGLWLLHDFLDESHTISQGLHTPEGSYWHAIMHRREPDASNAAYWFRRVGEHPVFATLAGAAADLGYESRDARWDPLAFINACESHRGEGDATEGVLKQVQRAEWDLLFDWCYRKAVGG